MTNFFGGISAVLWTFGHEKKILHKIHKHIRAAFGRCLKRGFPTDTHWSASGGQASNLSNSLRKVSPAMGGAKFRWVVSVLHAHMAALAGETLAANRIATRLFLLFWGVLGGFVGSSHGYVQVTVIGR